jgi:hypothetical protein
MGPEPACGILAGVATQAARDWLKRNHKNIGHLSASHIGLPSKWTWGLVETAEILYTEHCSQKGHLFKLELTNSPVWGRCLNEDETTSHVSLGCEATGHHIQPSETTGKRNSITSRALKRAVYAGLGKDMGKLVRV